MCTLYLKRKIVAATSVHHLPSGVGEKQVLLSAGSVARFLSGNVYQTAFEIIPNAGEIMVDWGWDLTGLQQGSLFFNFFLPIQTEIHIYQIQISAIDSPNTNYNYYHSCSPL